MHTRSRRDRTAAGIVVRLVGAAALLLGLLLGAGLLVTRVLPGTDVERAETAASSWLADERTPPLDAVSGPVAELGNTGTIAVLGVAAIGISVAVLRRWWPALLLTVALVGELALFLTTTALIDRPRPSVPHLDAELPPTSSFPSGHTAASICLYGGIAALVLATTRARWRWLVLAGAVLVVTLVAAARLYRGAHFPTDVLGSILFAVPWLLIAVHLLGPDPQGADQPTSEDGRPVPRSS